MMACLATVVATAGAMADDYRPFVAAKAIWPGGRALEKNLQVGFRAVIQNEGGGPTVLRLTASTLYRASVNGKLVGYGPARGPHGWYRVDELDISKALKAGKNVVAVEVAGYNVNSYYTIDEPSFLQAEVVRDGRALAATGKGSPEGFDAAILSERVQKVQRYSFQRPFSEVYRLRPDHDRWKVDSKAAFESVACVVEEDTRRYLPRVSPYPDYALRKQPLVVGRGEIVPQPNPGSLWKDRSLTGISGKLKGYPESELAIIPSIDMQKVKSRPDPTVSPEKE